MQVRYRVLQSRWPQGGEWRNWGFFYAFRKDDRSGTQVDCHHNMDELHWIVHHIRDRLEMEELPLERVDEAVAKYADGFRVLPEIHVYEGDERTLSGIINAIEAYVLNLECHAPRDDSEEGLRIFSGSANRPLAQAVAHRLGISISPVSITLLPDSEVHVQIEELVRKKDVFVIQPCSAPVNTHLIQLLLMIDALRRASVNSITAIVPYFPYARQERMARGREAISARVVATMLETVGADRVIYVDIHAQAIQGFFTVPVDPLQAYPILAHYFRGKDFLQDAVIVSPDVGRARLADKYARALGLPMVVVQKRRHDFRKVTTTHVVGDVEGKIPILIDDIVASGSVLDQIPVLFEHGARPEVHLVITHPVLLPSALERLDREWIKEMVVTDTVIVPPAKRHPKLRMVSVAPLLAHAIRNIYHGRSVSPLWDFDAPRKLGFYDEPGLDEEFA